MYRLLINKKAKISSPCPCHESIYREAEVELNLTSALDRREWLTSHPGFFIPRNEQEVRGPQNQLKCFREEKNLKTEKPNRRNESITVHSLFNHCLRDVVSTCICHLEKHANKTNNNSSMVNQKHASCPHNVQIF
jgi:hypothetical protein